MKFRFVSQGSVFMQTSAIVRKYALQNNYQGLYANVWAQQSMKNIDWKKVYE